MKPITVVLKLKTKYEIAQVLRLVDPQTDPDTFDTLLVAWREACKRERHWRRNARKRSAS
jgi:mitochondrial fission protein ELM1